VLLIIMVYAVSHGDSFLLLGKLAGRVPRILGSPTLLLWNQVSELEMQFIHIPELIPSGSIYCTKDANHATAQEKTATWTNAMA
jgi:hypothetical protein